jgi:hypothetical protein
MTRTARLTIACVLVVLLAAAGVVAWIATRPADDGSSSPAATTATPRPSTTAPSAGPSDALALDAAPAEPVITTGAAQAALASVSAGLQPAEQPVQLSAVCEGAVLAIGSDDQAVFSSLQTPAAPLRFLDVAIAVYPDSEAANDAYVSLAGQVAPSTP